MYALNNGFRMSFGSFVAMALSRLVRRMQNLIGRISFINFTMPRHLGSFLLFCLFLITAIYGCVIGGYSREVLQVTAAEMGFAVKKVDISGNNHVATSQLVAALELNDATSLLGFDAQAARSRLTSLPWIETADVRKIYPNQVHVKVVERRPYAIWQHENHLDVVDNTGHVIVPFSPEVGANLPLIVGLGATEDAAQFIDSLRTLPKIFNQIHAFVRVGDRRWDIVLDNGIRIKLPVEQPEKRLREALFSPRTADLFNKDVTSIDLRLGDRVTVALAPEALARRNAVVQDRDRQQKNREANRA